MHSPLLGPGSWAGVARSLELRGDTVYLPDLRAALLRGPPFARAQAALAAEGVVERVVVVVHSAAGTIGPLVASALPVEPAAVIYVDATLPIPGRSRVSLLPREAVERLMALVVDDGLPPWPAWWPAGTIAGLLPDERQRALLLADSPAIPVALLTERLPGDSGLNRLTSAYIRLSAPYDGEADRAVRLGWPVRRHDSHHLEPLSRPDVVAEWIAAAAAAAADEA